MLHQFEYLHLDETGLLKVKSYVPFKSCYISKNSYLNDLQMPFYFGHFELFLSNCDYNYNVNICIWIAKSFEHRNIHHNVQNCSTKFKVAVSATKCANVPLFCGFSQLLLFFQAQKLEQCYTLCHAVLAESDYLRQ